MTDLLLLLLGALLIVEIYMTLTWFISRAIKNSGIVDVAWASGFSILCVFYMLTGHQARNLVPILLAAMLSAWSIRLTWHLTTRFLRWFPEEDVRYTELKAKLGQDANFKMYLIFLWQGAILCLLTAPMAVAAAYGGSSLSILQIFALLIWLSALAGESISDAQLSRFSKDPANKGKTCTIGLWSISRHPNYFFEWLGSVSFSLFVLELPFGAWTLLCPLVLLHLLLNVTGVKPAEEHSLKTRSDYADYVKTTSPFFPWWRKRTS